jgi:predicted nucleotidyltransferase component of viral defense system
MDDGAMPKYYHEDQTRFRDALTRTASDTGFSERLIEKDYYCSVLLRDFAVLFGQGLVFKGGTCLSKVHIDFFRLSEDLDFGLSMKPDASRGECRRMADPIKGHLADVVVRHPFFLEVEALVGKNNNKQFNGTLAYRSVLTGDHEFIKVEVSLREEILLPSEEFAAKTMLLDPLANVPAIAPIIVRAVAPRGLRREDPCGADTAAAGDPRFL